MDSRLENYFPQLARNWEISKAQLQRYWDDLRASYGFLEDFNRVINNVAEFSGVKFSDVRDLRNYRCLLYLLTRALRPVVFIETGVLNGFSSAFILLAMQHNQQGTLYSIDLPPDDEILKQGNRPLPEGKSAGWVIPQSLRASHHILFGRAQVLLPQVLAAQGSVDVFLHDSDHSYPHMMFELGLVWAYLRPGGWLVCDNVEANSAFMDFERGVNGRGTIVPSFDTAARTWKHGLLQKPKTVHQEDRIKSTVRVMEEKNNASRHG
jgi:predicted O-methyltransferase YrrM